MLVDDQIVEVKWNNHSRKWYEDRGYRYTKRNEPFKIPIEDIYERATQKVRFVCDYCGKEYMAIYYNTIKSRAIVQKDCCSSCAGKKASEVSRLKMAPIYIERAKNICKENGYTLLTTINEYMGLHMSIRFVCDKHGEQHMVLDNFLRGCKCKKCSYVDRIDNLRRNKSEVIRAIESVNGNKLLNPDAYKNASMRNLRIQCACGNVFSTSFSNYTRANINRCSRCSQKDSLMESTIMRHLDENNIGYIREKRFDDCRDTKPLPFDFFIPANNLIIEFDGIHHYKNIRGDDAFNATCRHDRIKDEYCFSHGIRIVRIPYWECKNACSIIDKELNICR